MSRCPGQDVCEACVRGRADLRLHQDRGLLGAGDCQQRHQSRHNLPRGGVPRWHLFLSIRRIELELSSSIHNKA